VKTKKCKQCGEEFLAKSSLSKFCNILCKQEHDKLKGRKKRSKVKKPVSKLKKTTLKRKADKLWRSVGKEKAVCEICKHYPELKVNYTQLQAHHIIGRRNMTLRWDLRNRSWLCPVHHTFGVKSAHSDPQWFIDYLKEYRLDDFEYLESVKNTITKVTDDYLIEKINYLNEIGSD